MKHLVLIANFCPKQSAGQLRGALRREPAEFPKRGRIHIARFGRGRESLPLLLLLVPTGHHDRALRGQQFQSGLGPLAGGGEALHAAQGLDGNLAVAGQEHSVRHMPVLRLSQQYEVVDHEKPIPPGPRDQRL